MTASSEISITHAESIPPFPPKVFPQEKRPYTGKASYFRECRECRESIFYIIFFSFYYSLNLLNQNLLICVNCIDCAVVLVSPTVIVILSNTIYGSSAEGDVDAAVVTVVIPAVEAAVMEVAAEVIGEDAVVVVVEVEAEEIAVVTGAALTVTSQVRNLPL